MVGAGGAKRPTATFDCYDGFIMSGAETQQITPEIAKLLSPGIAAPLAPRTPLPVKYRPLAGNITLPAAARS